MRERKRWKHIIEKEEERRAPLKESNVLCAPRKHMVAAANSKSGAESIEVCIANKEARNTAGFWETVPDLK